jgi:hypothetical protein
MGAQVTMASIKYLPALGDLAQAGAVIRDAVSPDDVLMVGEYGTLAPIALHADLKQLHPGKIFLELITQNKNRDLVRSFMATAAASGFDGVVIATGVLKKEEYMARPVYDIDPTQVLKMAIEMRKAGLLPPAFAIGIRTASGCCAVIERARYLVDSGADFLASHGDKIEEFRNLTISIEEIG